MVMVGCWSRLVVVFRVRLGGDTSPGEMGEDDEGRETAERMGEGEAGERGRGEVRRRERRTEGETSLFYLSVWHWLDWELERGNRKTRLRTRNSARTGRFNFPLSRKIRNFVRYPREWVKQTCNRQKSVKNPSPYFRVQ